MKRYILFAISILAASICCSARTSDAYEKCVYNAPNGVSLNYRLLRPVTEQSDYSVVTMKYPLVIFLHGSGERGDENEKQLEIGGNLFSDPANRAKFPSYVIFPQCPEKGFWSYKKAPSKPGPEGLKSEKNEMPIMQALMSLIEEYKQMPEVDADRVYIVGLSMGGMAVYDMLCRHPETFAAGVAICGAVDPSRLESIKNIPVRIFHGKKDNVVPSEASEVVYSTLKQMGAPVELIEFPKDGHNSWDSALAYPDFLDWIYNQTRHPVLSPTLATAD